MHAFTFFSSAFYNRKWFHRKINSGSNPVRWPKLFRIPPENSKTGVRSNALFQHVLGLRENNWFRLHFPRNRSPLNSTEYDDDEFYSDHLDSQMDELFSETEVQFGEMANEDSDPDNEFVPLIEQKLVEG